MSKRLPVRVWRERIVLPSYLPAAPDVNPMFLEKRVYQGSSGRVYPLPYIDRISETKTNRRWSAVWLENQYLRVMILPELGGRIHVMMDKTNGYDLIYRQRVIKPALVGLAGPWISGGIEFNWPQHHRPATFLPVDVEIEEHTDGSRTVWLSDHDPMCRMKGMHGVCLHPDKSLLEIKARAYNRTPLPQTFLWWVNMGVRVHAAYQSFFPPDVRYIADHAKRATSDFPLCRSSYYGINYGKRARSGVPARERPPAFVPPHCGGAKSVDYAPNDLSWYANIPTPCSYMCMGSKEDFLGGYDHARQAGIVHVADHHIAPGKKQWTWGNHDFGYAWDRNLTNEDGPYVELMAGVFTDNQPDFSFLQPGETKSWSQFLYPIQKIGPAHHANAEAAAHLAIDGKKVRVGVAVSSEFPRATIRLEAKTGARLEWKATLKPGTPFIAEQARPARNWLSPNVKLRVLAEDGREILSFVKSRPARATVPPAATEPLPPKKIETADELYLIGLHLDQYRHATRCPRLYWNEALRRDPLDCRCNNAMGLWRLRRGEFEAAEKHFRAAIKRLTIRNANPPDSEPFYNLGLCLRYRLDALPASGAGAQQLFDEAYDAFYKATWSHAWQSAAFHALAEMDCRRGDWETALAHLNSSLRFNTDNLRGRDLKAIVLGKLGRISEADELLRATLALDPLDWWARHLTGEKIDCDLQTQLDIGLDFVRAGLYSEAIELLRDAAKEFDLKRAMTPEPASQSLPTQSWGARPLVDYQLGWLYEKLGKDATALVHFRRAAALPPEYCFPSRVEEIAIFESAMRLNPLDARAPYYLGDLLFDGRRHEEAIELWEKSARLDISYSVVWRNLGLAYFNVTHQPAKARQAYERAFRARPGDARLLYERDQLWKALGDPPQKRLAELKKYSALAFQRDNLAIELCALYNQTGRPEQALQILKHRRFQPWEGGEGLALAQHVRAHLALGRKAFDCRDFSGAQKHFETALTSPANLGEAKHPLANQSDVHYWLGEASFGLGDEVGARKHWLAAANSRGDFQNMRVRNISEMTYFSALACGRLGKKERMKKLSRQLLSHARKLVKTETKIDFFAASSPNPGLFEEDLQFRQQTNALTFEALARLGMGQRAMAKRLFHTILKRDPNHALAFDLIQSLHTKTARKG